MNLEESIGALNLADNLDDEKLDAIGSTLLEQIKDDILSRADWEEQNREWLKLAAQVKEPKDFPWKGASNIKFPLITTAAVQFHSRALPNLISNDTPVRAKVLGADKDQKKQRRVHRVERFMSYQILEEMEDWIDELDRLLMILPIVGICYKKTFYSSELERTVSKLVLPTDMFVNYHAQSYARARITHRMYMDSNEFLEMQNDGIFLDVELTPQHTNIEGVRDIANQLRNVEDTKDQPYELYESHCWYDIDDDGYKEPYIITIDAVTGKVLRIVARWSEEGLYFKDDGRVRKIVPEEYITPFIFMPDPNSAVFGVGLGTLVGPLNESVNTIINQLVDAGTLSNMQGGFLARGVKLKGGSTRFAPGEWKLVNTTGDDLRKGVFPMPVREPSGVLFNLLGLLIDSGQRVASVSDMMVGESPGQNQPATTTMAVLEQGLKVFSSIYKRVHRALGKEYKKLYRLNYLHLDEDYYKMVLDGLSEPITAQQPPPQQQMPGQGPAGMPPQGTLPPGTQPFQGMPPEQANQMEMEASIEDFESDNMDVLPASDPSIVSDAQKVFKAQSLMEKAAAGMRLNPTVVARKVLEAEGHEDIEQLMDVPPPQPDPKFVLEEAKFKHQVEMDRVSTMLDGMRIKSEGQKDLAQAKKMMADAKAAGDSIDIQTMEISLKAQQAEHDQASRAFEQQMQKMGFLQGLAESVTDKDLARKKLDMERTKNAPTAQ